MDQRRRFPHESENVIVIYFHPIDRLLVRAAPIEEKPLVIVEEEGGIPDRDLQLLHGDLPCPAEGIPALIDGAFLGGRRQEIEGIAQGNGRRGILFGGDLTGLHKGPGSQVGRVPVPTRFGGKKIIPVPEPDDGRIGSFPARGLVKAKPVTDIQRITDGSDFRLNLRFPFLTTGRKE